jgi:hypothetical protein
MTKGRLALLVIGVVVVGALAAGVGIVSVRASSLASALADLGSFAGVMQRHVEAADLDAVAGDLDELDDLAQDALIAASDPALAAAGTGVPFIGNYLDAVREVASAAAGLTSAARPLAAVLPRIEPQNVVSGGRYDIDALSDLDVVVRDLTDQLAISNRQIAAIETDGLDSRVATAIDSLGAALTSGQSLLGQAEPLIRLLPVVLGSDGTWFVALQNLAEARGTGGLLGAYTVLNIADGSVEMVRTGSDADLVGTPPPLDGVPKSFIRVWGDNLDDWRSVNVSPDFPLAGRLIANEWKAVAGQDVDGVLAIGQGIVQYMLAATGPVEIDGSTIDANNVVSFLTLDVYARYPDSPDKNAIVAQLVGEIFSRIQDGQFDLESLISVASATTTADRVLLWSPHEDVQAQIIDLGLDGTLPTEYGPTIAVSINNRSGNKLEQFLHVNVDYQLGQCDPDPGFTEERIGTVTITLTNEAPTSGLPAYVTPRSDLEPGTEYAPGSNVETVSVYGPRNSYETKSKVDGKGTVTSVGDEGVRPVFQEAVELQPGQTRTLVIEWTEPTVGEDTTDVLGSQPRVILPASLNPITVTTPRAESCL